MRTLAGPRLSASHSSCALLLAMTIGWVFPTCGWAYDDTPKPPEKPA